MKGQRIRRKLSWKICERVHAVRWRMFIREAGGRALPQSPRVIAARQAYRVNFQVIALLLENVYKI